MYTWDRDVHPKGSFPTAFPKYIIGITTGGYKMYSVGKVFENTNGLRAEITKVLPNKYREIKFIETDYISQVHISNIKKGIFKDYYAPSVYNVGYAFKNAHKKHPFLYRTFYIELGLVC